MFKVNTPAARDTRSRAPRRYRPIDEASGRGAPQPRRPEGDDDDRDRYSRAREVREAEAAGRAAETPQRDHGRRGEPAEATP